MSFAKNLALQLPPLLRGELYVRREISLLLKRATRKAQAWRKMLSVDGGLAPNRVSWRSNRPRDEIGWRRKRLKHRASGPTDSV